MDLYKIPLFSLVSILFLARHCQKHWALFLLLFYIFFISIKEERKSYSNPSPFHLISSNFQIIINILEASLLPFQQQLMRKGGKTIIFVVLSKEFEIFLYSPSNLNLLVILHPFDVYVCLWEYFEDFINP